MWAGPAQINGPGSAQGKGWVDLGPEYFLFSSWVGPGQTSQLGWAITGPAQMPCLIICRNVNSYCSRSACNRTVAEAADGRRRRLPGSVVMTVIRRLSWWSGRRRCEERWKSWRPVAEEAKEEEENGRGCREEREGFTVALGGRLVASCGGADGGKTSDEGGGGWSSGEREGKKNCRNVGRRAGFWPTLDPIFSSFRPSTPPLFIGGWRG